MWRGLVIGSMGVLIGVASTVGAVNQVVTMAPGDTLDVSCPTTLSGSLGRILCAAIPTASPTMTTAPTMTIPPRATASPTSTVAPPTATSGPDVTFIGRTMDLLNQQRATNGLPPLRTDVRLAAAADAHNQWMRDHGCFAHVCTGEPALDARIRTAGYVGMTAWGENIAFGYRTPEAVVEAWMASPGHRANILGAQYADVGCAFLEPSAWWTCDYARQVGGAIPPLPTAIPSATSTSTAVVVGLPLATPRPTSPVTICGSTPINIGNSVAGVLSETDCHSIYRITAYADRYTLDATAGQQIAIAMTSNPPFDTYLYLIGPDGVRVASDDDGGGNLQSRIPAAGTGFFTLPTTGTYTIEATSFPSAVTGAYILTIGSN